MDDLLPVLLSFPPHPPPIYAISDQQYDENIKSLVENLRKLSVKQLLQPTSSGENILNVINPALNTVPYVHALLANISAFQSQSGVSTDGEYLWQKMRIFLENFDERQIRYVGTELNEVIAAVADFARQSRQPSAAIAPIACAILRLDPSGATLTSNHILLLQLCLESQNYADAKALIDKHVLYFPGITVLPKAKLLCSLGLSSYQYITPDSGLTRKLKYQDVLEFFIYSGTVYIGLQDWDMAAEALESAITYPVKDNAVSKIMVDAYKKWVLVNILLHGKAASLPSTTNSNAAKLFHSIAKPYDIVASLFESATASRLNSEVTVGQEIWRRDGNTGLMYFILAAFQKYQIRKLSNVYRTISISKITEMTISAETGTNLPNDAATETLISDMIARNELQGVVLHTSNEPAILSFSLSGLDLSEFEVQNQLASSLFRVKWMTEEMKSIDRRLTHDKEYLKWAFKQRKSAKTGPGDGYATEELNYNIGMDEDLMAA